MQEQIAILMQDHSEWIFIADDDDPERVFRSVGDAMQELEMKISSQSAPTVGFLYVECRKTLHSRMHLYYVIRGVSNEGQAQLSENINKYYIYGNFYSGRYYGLRFA